MHSTNNIIRRHPTLLKGMTLIEILISLVVLSLGLLGVAAMQGKAMQGSHDGYLYSQATALAYELAERIRVNNNAAYDSGGMVSTLAGASTCESTTAPCTATQMASYDINSWLARVSALPSGRGKVSGTGGTNPVRTIIVQWRGFSTPNCDASGGTSSTLDSTCFTLTVQP